MAMSSEQRLVEVEIKLTHQERLTDTLNEVVIELRGELDALRKQLDRLVQEQQAGDPGDPGDEPPPHY